MKGIVTKKSPTTNLPLVDRSMTQNPARTDFDEDFTTSSFADLLKSVLHPSPWNTPPSTCFFSDRTGFPQTCQ